MSAPPLKRMKSEVVDARLDHLSKSKCSFPEEISPGSMQGSRIAVRATKYQSSHQILLASGNTIYSCSISEQIGKTHTQGLGNIFLPTSSQDAVQAEPMGLTLPGEIQNLTMAVAEEACICAADSCGNGLIECLDRADTCATSPIHLPSPKALECGWSGIEAWSEAGVMHSAIASHPSSCLSVYTNETLLRRVGTLDRPNAIASVHGSQTPLIALAEGVQVTLWDARVAEGRGCVSRLTPGGAELPLYAIAADSSGTLVAAGGAESTAFVFDVRKGGQPIDRWPGCVKHDILSIKFPVARSDFLFVGGADQNVRCGTVDSRQRKAALKALKSTPQQQTRGKKGEGGISFRGDSRWLGLARDLRSDVIACLTASSSIVIAKFSFPDIS